MQTDSEFITVGSSQVSLQCMVSLADVRDLQEMASRLGGIGNVQSLVDLVTAIQQGDMSALAGVRSGCMVSLGDIHCLKVLGDRLGGLITVKALVDLLSAFSSAAPAEGNEATVRRVALAANGAESAS